MRVLIFTFLLLAMTMTTLSAADKQQIIDGSAVASEYVAKEANYVKVSEITEKSVETLTQLKDMNDLLVEDDDVKDMKLTLVPYCDSVDVMLEGENYKNIDNQTVRELQKMSSELSVQIKHLEGWEKLIKANIEKYDDNRALLKKQLLLLENTETNAKKEDAPKELLKYLLSVIKEIQGVENSFNERYNESLRNSQLLTTKLLTLKEIKETIKETESIVSNRVFYQNQPPLLTLLKESEFSLRAYSTAVVASIKDKYSEARDYLQTNSDLWLLYAVVSFLSLAFVVFYNKLYRKGELFVSKTSIEKDIFFFMGRPFATSAILLTLAFVIIFSNRPSSLGELMLLFVFIPVIRVLQTVIKRENYKYLYSIFAIYVLFWIVRNSVEYDIESRVFLLLINGLLLAYAFTLARKKILFSLHDNYLVKIAHYVFILFTLALVVAIASNLYGSVLLSVRIIKGVLSMFYTAMIFYTIYIVLAGYIVVILRRRIATASHMLEKYSQKIEKTTHLLIKVWVLLWWLLIVSKTISLYPYLVILKDAILSFSFKIAQTTISIQAIFDFVFIVIGTWVIARLTKTVLEVEVFARFTLPRGVPTAILTTLNYVIVITGTIIAFSSLGVSPQQFALIFGALGVGIGFGLRNIIANFVSGIIMVFERPVQIGDTIEMENTMGSVQSIGARSSTIKTFDGSEVIIPNADFIAKEIINWTLSDEHRRKVVEFKVDLENDNDIDKILKIMKDVASAHPDVLSDPEPLATLKSFGEYYLEFKLYFWLSTNLIPAQSEVNIAIYRALKEAGIKMPVPKTNLKGLTS